MIFYDSNIIIEPSKLLEKKGIHGKAPVLAQVRKKTF
jgi:hypothetical protein